jgi:hypothetical protein
VRNRFLGSILAAVVVLAVSAVLLSRMAQRPETGGAASAPSTPDLSGVWMQRAAGDTFTKEVPPLQPWAEERTKANVKAGPQKDPESSCFPSGMPRIFVHQYPIEILQVPGRVIMFFEYDHFVRQIWTDGRKHPKEEELEHTWMGHSIGSWDDDTLVVDSVGFNDKTWLDNAGHPHSDALHVVERIRRVDHDTLQIDFTFDDPKAYTKPWSGQRVFRFRPGWEITEQVCADTFLWKEPGK